MKRKRFYTAILIAVSLLAASCSSPMGATDASGADESLVPPGRSITGTEILTNGGFAGGSTANWIVTPGGQFTIGQYKTSYYGRLSGEIGQDLTGKLQANTTYELEVLVKGASTDLTVQTLIATTANGSRQYYFAPSQVVTPPVGPFHTPFTGSKYLYFRISVGAVGTDTRFWFHTQGGSPTAPTLLVDNFSLKKVVTDQRPFPQQVSYPGIIKPSNYTQDQLNQQVRDYYSTWKSNFLTWYPAPNDNVCYIAGPVTGAAPDNWAAKGLKAVSASEHTGYGMLVFAMMAGYDREAKVAFDGLVRLYNLNRSTATPALMSWIVPDKITDNSYDRSDSAPDGDMDIAYALLMADKQWGSIGEFNYLAMAKTLIGDILKGDILANGLIDLGDWSKTEAAYAQATRPSDWMLSHIAAFEKVVPNALWATVKSKIFANYTSASNATSGLISDFVNKGKRVAAYYCAEPFDTAQYTENASRVPWRFALGFAQTQDAQAKTVAAKFAKFITGKIGTNWALVHDGYNWDGTDMNFTFNLTNWKKVNAGEDLPGNEGDVVNTGTHTGVLALQFIAPFLTSCTVDPAYQAALNTGWDYVKTLHAAAVGNSDAYFKDSLTLMSMLYISGNWWNPQP